MEYYLTIMAKNQWWMVQQTDENTHTHTHTHTHKCAHDAHTDRQRKRQRQRHRQRLFFFTRTTLHGRWNHEMVREHRHDLNTFVQALTGGL